MNDSPKTLLSERPNLWVYDTTKGESKLKVLHACGNSAWQENREFEASLGFIVRPVSKTKKQIVGGIYITNQLWIVQ